MVSDERWFLGADPGLTGAVVIWNPEADQLRVFDMPVIEGQGKKGQRVVNPFELSRLIRPYAGRIAGSVVEQVGSRPGQAVGAIFSFGDSFGALRGAMAGLGLPLEYVKPELWKRAMGVTSDKSTSLAMATELLPRHANNWTRKKDDGRAEAALLAVYAHRKWRAIYD